MCAYQGPSLDRSDLGDLLLNLSEICGVPPQTSSEFYVKEERDYIAANAALHRRGYKIVQYTSSDKLAVFTYGHATRDDVIVLEFAYA